MLSSGTYYKNLPHPLNSLINHLFYPHVLVLGFILILTETKICFDNVFIDGQFSMKGLIVFSEIYILPVYSLHSRPVMYSCIVSM